MNEIGWIPAELLEGVAEDDELERAARLGRFAVLQEMGYFGVETNTKLARNEGSGSWVARVRRKFSNTYGNSAGCSAGDLEVAAEMLGVFNEVYNIEALVEEDDGAD